MREVGDGTLGLIIIIFLVQVQIVSIIYVIKKGRVAVHYRPVTNYPAAKRPNIFGYGGHSESVDVT